MEHLIHTRNLLNTTLHQSRHIDFQLHKTSANVSRITHTLETAFTNMASKCATFANRDHVNRALPPVSAVFKVYQLVDELGRLVSAHSSSDLPVYLSLLKRFRQALTLLTNTCKLAVQWVQDVKQFLENTTLVALGDAHDHPYYYNICKTLHLLEQLQETERSSLLDQGILSVAFQDIENEFGNLLIHNSLPLQVPSYFFSSGDEESDVSDPLPPPPPLPFHVVQNLKEIVACFMACDNPLDQCMSRYIKVRSTIVEESLQGLDLDYLDVSLSEFDSVQDIEGYIDEWVRHLEFVVKHLLELEYTLCDHVFGQYVQWTDCFSKIALQSGIQCFIKFGNTITKGKKEAIKLFKLLDMFAALKNLRQDFNRIFGGKPCSEIRAHTRDLIKKVVNGACEIFQELSAQVQLQRLTDPPPDGTLPRLVSFVTEYSEELLDDDYRTVLDQVVEIHCSWYSKKMANVSVEVHNIVKLLELNLETWAKRYKDSALSYIFIMNTSYYLSKHLKGTRLGDVMGESWLKRHEDKVEYYTTLYLRESWEKIPALLTNNDRPMVVSDVNKNNRIRVFNDAFDQVYKKQSGWVLCDSGLRWKTCQLILQVLVPVYNSYMHKYFGLLEAGAGPSPNKYVKYSAESLENMVTSMFQPKSGSSSTKRTNLICKIKSVVAGRFSPTTALQLDHLY